MSASRFKIVAWALGAIAGTVTLLWLHGENSRLRHHVSERSSATSPAVMLRDENTRIRDLIESSARSGAINQAQLQQARTEVAALEKKAATASADHAAQAARDAAALNQNRDPRQGLVRLANFQNSGQATPANAVQTAIWAAMQGDSAALKQVCVFNAEARRKLDAFIARLPEAARGQWTPEKLALLSLTNALTEFPALQILGETRADPEHMLVMVRGPQPDQTEKIGLIRTPSGWKVALPSSVITKLEKTMLTSAP